MIECSSSLRQQLLATVKDAYADGLCLNPVCQDGSKTPLGESDSDRRWKRFQNERPEWSQISKWYENPNRSGLGLFCGKVSGNLEALDFDDRGIYIQFKEIAIKSGLSDLVSRIESLYLEHSPNGVHWLYRCDEISSNCKLATRPKEEHEKKHPKDNTAVLIETRGEGGFIIIAPTFGPVNPAGSYTLISGNISTIPTITVDERKALHELARSFHVPDAKTIQQDIDLCRKESGVGAERPGDDFNIRGSWEDLLQSQGWHLDHTRGDTSYWTRPGKMGGVSASTNHAGSGLFYVFSTATDFQAERGYTKFHVYTKLNHGGDFSSAAKELALLGYGNSKNKPILPISNVSISNEVDTCTEVAVPDLFTDMRVSTYFAKLHIDRLRYWTNAGKWLVYNGARWSTSAPGGAYPYIKDMIKHLYYSAHKIEDVKKRVDFINNILKLEAHTKQTILLAAAQFIPELVINCEQLDQNPMLLNVNNGTIDLKTGKIMPHSGNDFITKIINIDYSPDNDCPIFLRFLERVMEGNHTLINYLQRFIGYCLTGRIDEQVLLFLYGLGSNGKTTLANIIEALFSSYAKTAGSDLLLRQDKRGPTNDIAALFGARLVKISECNDGEMLDEARVKTLTGEDRVTCRFLYKEPFSYTPTYKIMMLGNYKPKIRGCDYGIWRRIHLLPFNVTISEGEKDKDLPAKLLKELPGILSWAVKGCLQWQEVGLKPPQEVLTEVNKYRKAEDVFQQWLEDCCILSEQSQASANMLYLSFLEYSRWQISPQKFGRMLSERHFTKCKSNNISWSGIGLLDKELG